MATHSSILAWKSPWTEEPGGQWSIESESDTTEVTQHACMAPSFCCSPETIKNIVNQLYPNKIQKV